MNEDMDGVIEYNSNVLYQVFNIIKGRGDAIAVLLGQKGLRVTDALRNNILHFAAQKNDISVLNDIFMSYNEVAHELLNQQNDEGKTPIEIAVESKSEEAQLFLIEQEGVEISNLLTSGDRDVLAEIIEQTKLLFDSIFNGQLSDSLCCIQNGGYVNVKIDGDSIIDFAACSNNTGFIKWYASKYLESRLWFEKDNNGLSPYNKAVTIWGEKSNIAKLVQTHESYSILINTLNSYEFKRFKQIYKKYKVNLDEDLKKEVSQMTLYYSAIEKDEELLSIVIEDINDLLLLKYSYYDESPWWIIINTRVTNILEAIFDLVINLSDKSKCSRNPFEVKEVLEKLFRIEKCYEAHVLSILAEKGDIEFFNLIFTKFDYKTITKLLSMQDIKFQTAMHVLAENIYKPKVYEIFDWILQSLPKACIKNLFLKRNIEGQSPYNVLKYMESDNAVKILEAINDYGINLETTGGGFFYNHENEY